MENRYTIYFEIYGKKLKTSVVAKSEKDAKLKVIEKLNFIKVVKETDYDIPEGFKDIFGDIFK